MDALAIGLIILVTIYATAALTISSVIFNDWRQRRKERQTTPEIPSAIPITGAQPFKFYMCECRAQAHRYEDGSLIILRAHARDCHNRGSYDC